MSATGPDPAGVRAGERGTTLVEALVVVTLLALVTAVQFPRLQQALTGAARGEATAAVAARLRQIRAEALEGDRPSAFLVSADGRAYGGGARPAVATPPGVTVRASGPIVFYGDGASGGGLVAVEAGGARSIVAVAETGLVLPRGDR